MDKLTPEQKQQMLVRMKTETQTQIVRDSYSNMHKIYPKVLFC